MNLENMGGRAAISHNKNSDGNLGNEDHGIGQCYSNLHMVASVGNIFVKAIKKPEYFFCLPLIENVLIWYQYKPILVSILPHNMCRPGGIYHGFCDNRPEIPR